MEITEKYLKAFAELEPLQEPREIPLNGYEKPANILISTDIPPEDKRASQINITYIDVNEQTEAWEFVYDRTKAKTLVIPQLDGNDIDTVGYEFEGLVTASSARKWYREKFGYFE